MEIDGSFRCGWKWKLSFRPSTEASPLGNDLVVSSGIDLPGVRLPVIHDSQARKYFRRWVVDVVQPLTLTLTLTPTLTPTRTQNGPETWLRHLGDFFLVKWMESTMEVVLGLGSISDDGSKTWSNP